jgi:hypothetical protein
MGTLTLLNPKEHKIVFGSIHFKFMKFHFNSNSIKLHSIQLALCKFKASIFKLTQQNCEGLTHSIKTWLVFLSVVAQCITRHSI